MRPEIVILRRTPIDVDIDMYEKFAQLWKSKITVVADTSFSEARLKCGYRERSPYFDTIILDKQERISIEKLFSAKEGAIFLIYGLGRAKQYIRGLIKHNVAFCIISERDNALYNTVVAKFIKQYFPIVQKFRFFGIAKRCKVFLAMGEKGIANFRNRYRIPNEILYDFMYCDGNKFIGIRPCIKNKPVKLIYVGRFEYAYKGLDTLLDAVKGLSGDFSLDLVGGYGKNTDDVMERIKKLPNTQFIGVWQNQEVSRRLHEYDVIVIPSKADGWNLHCNLAIRAGIAAVATDEAISNELISSCGNGIVVPAGDVIAMRAALQRAIDNPNEVNVWKQRTEAYANKISSEIVAQYLFDVLSYAVLKTTENRPVCPWLSDNRTMF